MNKRKEQTQALFENVMPWLILAILLIYTYAKFFRHSYLGFRVDSTGQIIFVFDMGATEPTLQVGDRLLQVDSIRWEDFRSDLREMIFPNVRLDQVVLLSIERGGREMTIPWKAPGPTTDEIVDLVVSEGWLAFFFWFAGTITLLDLRPKDERWYLIIAFNYLTALILAFGSGVSFYHIWESAILQRIIVWLCVPIYLHLHWIFPYPFRKLPHVLLWAGYSSALLLGVAEWFQVLPHNIYFMGFLLAFGGSIILLLLHAIIQPKTRRDLRLFFVVSLVAFLPSIATGIVGSFVEDQSGRFLAWIGGGALLSLPLLPLAYFYAVYRHQLGKLELRVNRLVTGYLFFTLLAVIWVLPVSLLAVTYNSPGATIVISIVSVIIAGLMILSAYPKFESFVERRLFDIQLPTENILEVYSTHITTSSSILDLLRLLKEDLHPSLLIRQFVFFQLDQGSLKVLSTMGLNEEQLPEEQDMPYLMSQSGVYRSPDLVSRDQPFPWVRLILPLRLGDHLLGFWLLGRRDPDDFYSQLEIPVLSSLANLTAIALSNILQTERLKAMYEANIGRYELERVRLARDLHDSILNEMAALLMRGDAPTLSPKFQQAFDELTERLREIVDDLRPPMLAFGLRLALADFAEELMERNQNSVEILTDIQADGEWRYSNAVENNLYRIMQEACENSLHHAHAKKLLILARLYEKRIDIRMEDDGIGFNSEISLKLDEMLANKHFGLVGMFERANLIGAEMSINSQPNQGTQIQVLWGSK